MKKHICLFIFTLFIFSCSSVRESDYVLSTGSSVIGVKMPILVHLADSLTLSESQLQAAVSINPKIDIKCTVNGGYTLAISAVKHFNYDTKYEVTLNLDKITAGKQKDKYKFDVTTTNPEYTFSDYQINIDKEGHVSISGDISSSDYIESDYIEQNFKILGQNLPIKWSHTQNGTLHNYLIDSIKRQADTYTIKLESRYHKTNTVEVTIPKLNSFTILSCKVETIPALQVVVTFSSALATQQCFDELISLAGKFNVVDNRLIIYPNQKMIGEYKLSVNGGIEDINGKKVSNETQEFNIIFPETTPTIKFVSRGSILPSSNNMTVLFQSVNYAKARVRVKKIYSNNLLQFFQTNNYNGDNIMYVAKVVKDTTFSLAAANSPKLRSENNYALNLSELITGDKGAIYRLEIKGEEPLADEPEIFDYEVEYYFGKYNTYANRSRNIIESDLGIIAKGDDNGNYTLFVTDLLTAKPVMGAVVTMYNNVNQELGKGETDNYGKIELKSKESPFIVMATHDNNKSYLKVDNGLALSLSNFDVGGTNSMSGIKGYIFGERGVWRPGDDIYLTFIVTSKDDKLPDSHPIEIELRNPKNQLITQRKLNKSHDGIYSIKLATAQDALTGNWEVSIAYGAEKFKKNIKIETIKPNRLKIDFKLNDSPLLPCNNIVASMNVKWLHGAVAAGSNVKVNVELSSSKTEFKGYPDYSFDDKTKQYTTEEKEILTGVTDRDGNVTLRGQVTGLTGNTPGVLNAKFNVKAFEQSGDFSIDQYITKLSPYDTYVGIQVKEKINAWGDKYVDIKEKSWVDFVALNSNGQLSDIKRVKVEIYKMGWDWWWDSSSEYALASYQQGSYNKPYFTEYVNLFGGRGTLAMNWEPSHWGRYLFRVSDINGSHSATKVCYVDDNYGRNSNGETEAATRLNITKDKDKYMIGEEATLTIPSSKGAKALISLESGSKLLKSYWIDCDEVKTNITIPIKEGMNPNIYAHVTLLQPHNNTLNDAPIRLYGVIKLLVEDSNSRLTPTITVADKVRPETEFTVTVAEKNGKAMSYVVAIVDEGLLDLTRFKTPDAWKFFNAEEAIGVRTWDLYDNVIGAYGGRIEQLFAIGGDDELVGAGKIKAERFKPVVHYIEAQKLAAGKKATHKIKLPPYFGSVRVMVIASNGSAQGSTEKRVEVKKPLLAQLTLPRVISTEEEIVVPVTLFAMEEKVGKVTVEISHNDLLTTIGDKTQSIVFDRVGEDMVYFRVNTGKKTGVGKVEITARNGNDVSVSKIEIDIRNANPLTTESKSTMVASGGQMNLAFPQGDVAVECSTMPSLNVSGRLNYLTSYPHGCIEQIVSGAFPQLYISDIMSCSAPTLESMEHNVKSTLDRLSLYQQPNGAFAYWPGSTTVSSWGTTYASHFMVEAERKGYSVNKSTKASILKYISKADFTNDTELAYSLYVLSLNGTPERGRMNRLREKANIDSEAAWLLAGAYVLDGKGEVANMIIKTSGNNRVTNNSREVIFGSPEREMSVMLMVKNSLGDSEQSLLLATEIAKKLNDASLWLSTQSTAWMLNSMSGYMINNKQGDINMVVNGESVRSQKAVTELKFKSTGDNITLKNEGKNPVYVVASLQYIPENGKEVARANGLNILVSYVDFSGKTIDPTNIKAGTDFFIDVTVQNSSYIKDYTNVALTHILPSGWEIGTSSQNSGITYQDVRDDRVLSYFDLKRNERKQIRVKATATYKGKYYLPAIYSELMYEGTINGSTKGAWINVN